MLHLCCVISLSALVPCGSLPWDIILPDLIPYWLPTGCGSQSTAPIRLCIMVPILQVSYSAHVPMGGSSSSPHAPPWAALHRLELHLCCSCWEMFMGCVSFRTSSTAVCRIQCGCLWRSALRGAHGLHGDVLLCCGPLLGCRELLLYAWSTSCPPGALTTEPAGLLLSCFSILSASCCSVFLNLS